MRVKFDEELKKLNNSLIEMGGLVEQAIEVAVKALVEQDIELAQKAISFDSIIDEKEKEIEGFCLKLLLQQQPVASDLLLISSVLKMITDLERIGDQAADISEITIALADNQYINKLEYIPQMASETMKMVTGSINAFVTKDLKLAYKVIASDDIVDNLFDQVRTNLIALIKDNTDNSDQAIYLLMIAKYLERIGDHATNIAEWVEFSITGQHNDSENI